MNNHSIKIDDDNSQNQAERINYYESLNLVDLELIHVEARPVSQRHYGPLETDGPATCLLNSF